MNQTDMVGALRSDSAHLLRNSSKHNIILVGVLGTGKTHLAIVLGLQAYKVHFGNVLDLVNQLLKSRYCDQHKKALDISNINGFNYFSFSRYYINNEWGFFEAKLYIIDYRVENWN